ncbi:MAG TPA: DUF4055 domain-containing protein, partial [Blastocatellia bacterium]|nr:DUF4055 domain-containing protein [Blastocatellia bacterium]
MRELKGKYLPKFPAEDPEVYADRVSTAVCFDATGQTKNGLVGLIFRKTPTLGETTDKRIVDQLENVDLAGTHWTVFTKEFEDLAVEFGHSIIVVDMPPKKVGATHEDDFDPGNRPYWLKYRADQAINWCTKQVGGQTILEQITFEECTTEKDGRFGEKEVTRYRVFFLEGKQVKWELYRKQKGEGGEDIPVRVEFGVFENVTEIPLSVAYGEKTGFLTSKPPLLKQALLNIKHFQQSSEFDNTLHIVGYPMLCSDDADADESTIKAVGPAIQVKVPRGSNVWYAEPEGSSLQWQDKNLENKERQMAAMGLSFLAEKVQVQETATENKIKHGERTSALATMAVSLKDALERSLAFHAQFIGLKAEQGGT